MTKFEETVIKCKSFRKVLVTGPQRSGTTFASKALSTALGYRWIDEKAYQVHNEIEFNNLIQDGNKYVIHCPAMSHLLPLNFYHTITIWMDRNILEVIKSEGVVVIGTVKGDIHEIGKSLVSTMLSANGFRVIDLGVDVSIERFVDTVITEDADILCLSALLTTTMLQQKKLIDALEKAGLRDKVKVLVGGAPVTESFAKEIGADGYAEDAISAVDIAYRLMDAPA